MTDGYLFLIKRTVRDRYLQVVYQQQRRTDAFSASEPSGPYSHGVTTNLHSSVGRAPGPLTSSNQQIDHAQCTLSTVRMNGWLSNSGVVRSKLTVGIHFFEVHGFLI